MVLNEDQFLHRYGKLNHRQQQAVDTIYGPVMVIAGPGTGKTEVLGMRIANLMRSEAQVQPHEILCLTYTDEATNSMRRRLVQIAGSVAHRVNIHTFHAFCNNIIQANSEYFSYRNLQPISDLELTDLLYEILNNLPQGHLLRKLSGDIYYDTPKLRQLFSWMKSEYLSAEKISGAIDDYLASLPGREQYIYKRNGRGFKAGDLKQAKIDEEIRRMETTRAAALLFPEYERRMAEMGRYDFNDMLLWVLNAFKEQPWMLQNYQERFQYILVDEFQDTNGAQNELLNALTAYWQDPNIFVVGDDDQSIYEFQGARIRNITDFYERYRETIKIVVLPHNYRSSQQVIDRAMATIQHNQQRLINQLKHLELNKNIIAASERFTQDTDIVEPVVAVYNNVLQEEADTILKIEALRNNGVALSDVAVLYAQHRQAANIMALMERRGIPYNAKKLVNILDLPVIQQILNILKYLARERRQLFSGEEYLFELLHAPWFGIAPNDVAKVSMYLSVKRDERWRITMGNYLLLQKLELPTARQIHRLSGNLERWEQQQIAVNLPLLLEMIVYEGGITNWMLAEADHLWYMQVLHTFFAFVKDNFDRNPGFDTRQLLETVDRMRDENISLGLERVVQDENGVKFFTAHSSKGNEFEHVFLIGCTKNYWEGKSEANRGYRLPDTLTLTAEDEEKSNKVEVARRLFYVALTRAKKYLTVSYAQADNNGKALETSAFVDEISLPQDRTYQQVPAGDIAEHLRWALTPASDVAIKIGNASAIKRMLQQFTMSATSLAKYLYCPLAFYYELILKVPFQKNDALAFGSAIHTALERFYLDMKRQKGHFPDKEALIRVFDQALNREAACFTGVQLDRRREQGHKILTEYYDHYLPALHKDVEIEMKIPRYTLEGVPVTAKIDKIELYPDGIKVIDYKTGDPERSSVANTAAPSEKEPNGGDYWRQMVFYKLVLERYEERNWRVLDGIFDYVQKDSYGQYKQVHIPIFGQDEAFVLNQMKEVYLKIMNHEFDRGCGREECHWCNFTRRYQLVRPAVDERVEMQ